MTKIILTGCAGFIGSNLSYELVRRGFNVIGIDNLSTGLSENISQERFRKLPGTFKFFKKDINDEDLSQTFE
jgi:nucleoside-diphosphate-sugar epimerase